MLHAFKKGINKNVKYTWLVVKKLKPTNTQYGPLRAT